MRGSRHLRKGGATLLFIGKVTLKTIDKAANNPKYRPENRSGSDQHDTDFIGTINRCRYRANVTSVIE